MRPLAPIVLVSTLAPIATGLELWFFGLRFGSVWIEAHKLSFLVWLPAIGIHVSGYLGRTGHALEELSASPLAGAVTRRSLVVGSLVTGVVLAVASLTYSSPFIFFRD